MTMIIPGNRCNSITVFQAKSRKRIGKTFGIFRDMGPICFGDGAISIFGNNFSITVITGSMFNQAADHEGLMHHTSLHKISFFIFRLKLQSCFWVVNRIKLKKAFIFILYKSWI